MRKVPVPVVYTDFLSQYSTVNVLMGLWQFVTAREIRVIEDCREELAALLRGVTPEWVLHPTNWKRLAGFARIIPDGDLLPLRAKYRRQQLADRRELRSREFGRSERWPWYAWPDLVASVLLTGKVPRIVEAFRIAPIGKAKGLKELAFRGQVPIDPRSQDFFKAGDRGACAVRSPHRSERRRARADATLAQDLGHATSYGIFAQMDRRRATRKSSSRATASIPTVPLQGQASRGPGRILLPAAGLAHYQRRPPAARALGAARH